MCRAHAPSVRAPPGESGLVNGGKWRLDAALIYANSEDKKKKSLRRETVDVPEAVKTIPS